MELYLRVRLACHVEGLSQREAASRFGIARETVKKMLPRRRNGGSNFGGISARRGADNVAAIGINAFKVVGACDDVTSGEIILNLVISIA